MNYKVGDILTRKLPLNWEKLTVLIVLGEDEYVTTGAPFIWCEVLNSDNYTDYITRFNVKALLYKYEKVGEL